MTKSRKTSIPGILDVIAVILFIGGFIAGIEIGTEGLSFALALAAWSTTFVAGILLMAVSEIIKQLQDIAYRISNLNIALDKTLIGKDAETINVADLPEL